jgi:hypothetical protein
VFGWIGKLVGRQTAADKSRDNPVVERAVQDAAVIYSEIPLCNLIDEARRTQLARELYLEINRICNALDPLATCREQLVATMLWVASYQVLVIPEAPAEDPSGLRGRSGITGELGRHLADLCRIDDELRAFVHEQTESRDFDTLFPLIEKRFWEACWLLRTLDATRRALGDARDDWFGPFLYAASARQEHAYRWELELPPAFDEAMAREAASVCAVFADIVLSGTEDPLTEWREYASSSGVQLPFGSDS